MIGADPPNVVGGTGRRWFGRPAGMQL